MKWSPAMLYWLTKNYIEAFRLAAQRDREQPIRRASEPRGDTRKATHEPPPVEIRRQVKLGLSR